MSDLSDYQNLRRNHPGWCTIESEPAIFNQILRDAGVTNTRVIELYSLDESILDEPDPIIGLIFLCRWRQDTSEVQEAEISCPDSVWFANQISENSCGSLAMINILFNAESVVLGEELAQLKYFTAGLTPPLRGLCLRNSEFLRKNHNSFARRSEIMQNNLDIIDSCKNTKGLANDNGPNAESAYHFIAYVPSGGSVWELDGLKRQPVEIGETDNTSRWLLTAMPRVQLQISKYSENELMFTLLALTQCTPTSHERPAMRMTSLEKDTLFPYATRVRHPYAAFMRHYIKVLAGKGIQVGYS
ncbi:hypothetical protein TWF569_001206 [Orbilia oligospora]|uniref:Ubiquitin carboxyl-terminal hydrolase n=2 Tax=Orbilia oligospora TaxID=2813651 RepID=A0A7C8N5G7_ORBOL|nr:hypothetical protein TWF102_000468 [Orbilia oligospora]KAF3124581.1 hypothetical protein TWF569_001206 [Orbilia oligospora]